MGRCAPGSITECDDGTKENQLGGPLQNNLGKGLLRPGSVEGFISAKVMIHFETKNS